MLFAGKIINTPSHCARGFFASKKVMRKLCETELFRVGQSYPLGVTIYTQPEHLNGNHGRLILSMLTVNLHIHFPTSSG